MRRLGFLDGLDGLGGLGCVIGRLRAQEAAGLDPSNSVTQYRLLANNRTEDFLTAGAGQFGSRQV